MAKDVVKKKSAEKSTLLYGWTPAYIGRLIAVLGALLYAQTMAFDYTQDDAIVITDNMFTKQGVSGIPGLLSHDTFYGYFKDESKTRLVSGGRYRPLTPVMFAIEYAIAGPKPWLSHLINAVSYGLLCWLIFGFAQSLLSKRLPPVIAMEAAFWTAAIFAVHPIHTEVVANIKGRDEIVAAIGCILGLWLTMKSIEEKRSLLYSAGAFVAFFAGLMSKENVITMLAVVPLTMWWYEKSPRLSMVKTMWPILAACVLFILIRGAVTGFEQGAPPKELMNNPFLKIENNNYVPFSFAEKTATITYTMGKYAQLLIFPYPLTHDYYPRHIEIQSWSKPLVILSLAFWLGMVYLVWRGWKSRSWYAYGILFYICTMSITSNIVFPIGTNMSERFAFLPSVGFALIAGMGLTTWMQRGQKKTWMTAGLLILVLGSGWTVLRSRVWQDNNTLFSTDVRTSSRSAKLLNAAGGNLITLAEDEKDPERKREMLLEAQGYLKQALEIHPNYKLGYLLLGNSSFHLGEYEKAIQMFRHVLVLDPAYHEGQRNLGVALRDFGKHQGEKNQNLVAAISLLEEAVTYLPDDFQTYHLLGVAYGQKGDSQKAIMYFQKEIELAPKNASAHFNLGVAYRQAGDMQKANAAFEQAKALDPDLPQFKNQ